MPQAQRAAATPVASAMGQPFDLSQAANRKLAELTADRSAALSRSAGKPSPAVRRKQDHFASGFELYGSFAGPPGQPVVSDVEVTTLLLRWQPPEHLGGIGFEVLGYRILVQEAGLGGFIVHTADTGSDLPQFIVEDLAADSWHEFQVAAITSAGVGSTSATSRPVQTDRAPLLLRELTKATRQLGSLRDRLERKRAEASELAQQGTRGGNSAPIPLAATSLAASTLAGLARGASLAGGADGGGGDGGGGDGGGAKPFASAEEVRQRRRRLRRECAALERRICKVEHNLSVLSGQQAEQDRKRRGELDEVALAAEEAELAEAEAEAEADGAAESFGTPFTGASVSFSGGSERRQTLRQAAVNRRKTEHNLAALEAYHRLFAEEDEKAKVSYTPYDREKVRARLKRALSRHVLADGGEEKAHYFGLALNRARSALTHNVFDRFGDTLLEKALLLFGRFDADHDGVLEFGDFCRVMLLVGSRVGATYHEADLVRMFAKVDLNGDGLIDLNEFLWMQWDPEVAVDDDDSAYGDGSERGARGAGPSEDSADDDAESLVSGDGSARLYRRSSLALSDDGSDEDRGRGRGRSTGGGRRRARRVSLAMSDD